MIADEHHTMNVQPEIDPTPDRMRGPRSQRDMVIASLLRCPDRDRDRRPGSPRGA